MPRKNALLPVTIISAGDMSGSLTSTVLPIQFEDNIGLQFVWTGTPTGTIAVQVSMDQTTWTSLTFNPSITQPAGSAGGLYIDINQISAPFMRATYTFSSGTGALTLKACGKEV